MDFFKDSPVVTLDTLVAGCSGMTREEARLILLELYRKPPIPLEFKLLMTSDNGVSVVRESEIRKREIRNAHSLTIYSAQK